MGTHSHLMDRHQVCLWVCPTVLAPVASFPRRLEALLLHWAAIWQQQQLPKQSENLSTDLVALLWLLQAQERWECPQAGVA